MKTQVLRLLGLGLLALSTTANFVRADRAADLRNEVIPPGATMTPPWEKYTGILPNTSGPTGYTPLNMRHAYGIDQLATSGQGQVIAIVDAYGSPTVQADLNTFCAKLGIPSTTVQVYYPQGTPPANTGWAVETSLDVEWAHAIAPGATIALVIAKSNGNNDLYAAVDYAAGLGAKQMSLSWGGSEYPAESSSDFHFNVAGVTIFASSGDGGAPAGYPSASPYVVGVGGTTLSLDSSGNYLSETAWSYSGGGLSVDESIPAFQKAWLNGTQRGVPDVAYDADPATGVPIYVTGIGWEQVGGTSMSAPQWAAISALANSLSSQPANSGAGVFYSLATANYAGYFHDITTGSNGNPAGPGYDLVTGLGSPLANQIVPALAGGFASQVAAPAFLPPGGTYASGSPQNVVIASATPNAAIRYTTDGSTPTKTSGVLYSGQISISSAVTLKAVAYASGLTDSPVTSENYTFAPQVAAPTFSLASGTYTVGQAVSMSTSTTGATIRYTTDGSTPTETNGAIYSGPVNMSGGLVVLNAIAYESGFIDSPIADSVYQIDLPPCPTAPMLSVAPGTYANAQTVAMTPGTAGTSILYTTDGSTPNEINGTIYSGTVYTGPVGVNSTTVLKAAGFENGVYDSGPAIGGVYTITSSPAVVLNVLHEFTGSNGEGADPECTLVQGTDGNFYGTTYLGGDANNDGTIFKMTPGGVLTTLVTLNRTNGRNPDSNLLQASDGNFYGMITYGGQLDEGVVFKMTPSGVMTTLVNFVGADGANPLAGGLIQTSDGNFYGMTNQGGAKGYGTVFKMTPAGVLTTLVSFDTNIGIEPNGNLLLGSDGNFYGTTTDDLIYQSGLEGTVFKMSPAGVLTTLVTFTGANGAQPQTAPVQAGDGNFYGTTAGGGSGSHGIVFKMTPVGVLTTLVNFSGPNGNAPFCGLTQGRDGSLYGTTYRGGASDNGTIFKITPSGVFTTLVSFDDANGMYLTGNLLQGSDGNFYGTASGGGVFGSGTVFELIVPTLAQAAAPIFSPPAGTYTSAQSVTITSTTSGAAIRYTTDGSTPTESNGTVYSAPVNIGATTLLQAIAYKSGYSDSSVTSGNYVFSYTIFSSNGFDNIPMSSSQSGTFTATFDASPSLSPSNATMALCKGNQTAYTGLSCIARFNTSGRIDAYNGTAGYQAANTISYSKGLTYHFRMVVNVPANTYSVYVTPPGGSETLVGSNFGFRKAATSLDTWNIDVNSSPGGSVTVSNLTIIGTQQAATPTFTPGAGTYTSPQNVTIMSATTGALIAYTTDGSTPTESGGTVTHGTPLANGGSVNIGSTATLKAIAFEGGFTDSGIMSGLYTINTQSQVAAPSFNPGGGTFGSPQNVSISTTTPGATIRYTTDDSAPTETNGTVYSSPVPIGTNTVLKAIAYESGMLDSAVTSANYNFQTATPAFTPGAGTYTSAVSVTISSTTTGASIAYTTDGSTPTESGGTVTHGTLLANGGTVNIATTATLNAIAFKSGLLDSTVASGQYTIGGSSRTLTGSSSDGWHALALTAAQTGTFTATFDATPSASPENAVVGLSKGAATGYSALSCIARFNPSGDIDAYNGTSGYQAASTIPYAKASTYHFRMVVNVSLNTYSVYVTPPGGSETLVGSNYGFRTAQSSLDTWNLDVNSTPSGCSLTANNLNP
jgi:uncharacterized repeat protein (TIGR03803 family)